MCGRTGLAGEYTDQLEGSGPTKNQTLAALRHFFDGLVTRHAVALNPFASVRGVKHSVAEGATPEISIEQARRLLRSVDTAHVVGLRDVRHSSLHAYDPEYGSAERYPGDDPSQVVRQQRR
jgi:hypothetical protein